MKQYDLSVLIPARHEEFLGLTIQDVLQQKRGNTEVICILDGEWPLSPIDDHPDLTLVFRPESIGQRAATNEAARISRAKYIMKLDAHCRVAPGFDVALMADCRYDWTVVPRMYNLHVFDWECVGCGNRSEQGPKPNTCGICLATQFQKLLVWHPRDGGCHHWTCVECTLFISQQEKPKTCPNCGKGKFKGCGTRVTDSMRFDNDLHFQYWRAFNKERREGQGRITETMSLIGACWFLHRDRYWELGGLDEEHGSWGQMGSEISCKSWLSGGRLLCNKKTWFSHLFRTQSGFSFPYQQDQKQIDHARAHSQDVWRNNKWPQAVRPLSWLLEHFWPVPGWTDTDLREQKDRESGAVSVAAPVEEAPRRFVRSAPESGLTKGVVYFTENQCPEPIFSIAQQQLRQSLNGHQLVSVSLKPMEFGDNIVLGLQRGYLTMFKQILAGLAHLDSDIAFLCEHDCLYPPEHFQFVPPRKDHYYYNEAIWRVSAVTGKTLFHFRKSVLALVADRRLLIDHYGERVARIEKEGFTFKNGFEPGTRSISRHGYDDIPSESYFSERPIVDIRDTGANLTRTNWKKEDFRYQRYTAGWTEGSSVPGWPGVIEGRFSEWLAELGKTVQD